MSEFMNKEQTITELKRIDSLFKNYCDVNDQIEMQEHKQYSEIKADKELTVRNAQKRCGDEKNKFDVKKPTLSSALLEPPPFMPKNPFYKGGSDKLNINAKNILIDSLCGIVSYICISIFILIGIITTVFPSTNNNAVGLFIMPVLFIGFFSTYKFVTSDTKLLFDWDKKCQEREKELYEWANRVNKLATKEVDDKLCEEYKAYKDAVALYKLRCKSETLDEMQASNDRQLKIIDKYQAIFSELNVKRDNLIDELANVTLIDTEFFPKAWRIAAILQHSRADSLKEAINLALEDERKEEEERQRQREAARQQAVLEQQAEDNRRHNEQMAEDNRRHNLEIERQNAQMAEDNRRHNLEMERQARSQAQAANKSAELQRQGAKKPCFSCKNSGKCSYIVKNQPGPCAAFTPN